MRTLKCFVLALIFMNIGVLPLTAESPQHLDTLEDADWQELSELMRLLRQEEQAHLFIPVAKLQLRYLLDSAADVEKDDAERAKEIRRFARGVAFNIASFTWPGWGDSPQPISQERQKLGLSAAERAVEIALAIDEPTPNSYWILGVHLLNAKRYDEAIKSFEKAKDLANNEVYRAMHSAWQQFARTAAEPSLEETSNLTDAIAQLREFDDEDAAFFADQLIAAQQVYLSNNNTSEN